MTLKAKNKSSKNSVCKVYKTCDHVPCGASMNKCTPSYCYPHISKNWDYCNMSNWKPRRYKKYKSSCRDESKCVLIKTKKIIIVLTHLHCIIKCHIFGVF